MAESKFLHDSHHVLHVIGDELSATVRELFDDLAWMLRVAVVNRAAGGQVRFCYAAIITQNGFLEMAGRVDRLHNSLCTRICRRSSQSSDIIKHHKNQTD